MNNTPTVTMRKFAEVNNVTLSRIRILTGKDKSVRVVFKRKSINYYDVASLDNWLANNRHRFAEHNVYKPIENGSLFYCTRCERYVGVGFRSNKLSLCCVTCEKQAASRNTAVAKEATTGKRVEQHVIDKRKRYEDKMHERRLKKVDDVNAWMKDERF